VNRTWTAVAAIDQRAIGTAGVGKQIDGLVLLPLLTITLRVGLYPGQGLPFPIRRAITGDMLLDGRHLLLQEVKLGLVLWQLIADKTCDQG